MVEDGVDRSAETDEPVDDQTNEIVTLVQQRLGDRIEQILAVAGGLRSSSIESMTLLMP